MLRYTSKRTILISTLVVIFITILIYYFGGSWGKDVLNLGGLVCSIIGIVYIIYELHVIHDQNTTTLKAIDKTIKELSRNTFVSNIARARELIQHIQDFVRGNRLELAIFRIQDVKSHLLHIEHYQISYGAQKSDRTNVCLQQLNLVINSLEKEVSSKTSKLNISKTNTMLEEVLTHLQSLEAESQHQTLT